MEAIEILKELMTGKRQDGKKPTVKELEEILERQGVTMLPDGSVTVIRVTETEMKALQQAISALEAQEETNSQIKLLELYLENTRKDLKEANRFKGMAELRRRVEELEKEAKHWHKTARDWMAIADKHEQEIQRLKKELKTKGGNDG